MDLNRLADRLADCCQDMILLVILPTGFTFGGPVASAKAAAAKTTRGNLTVSVEVSYFPLRLIRLLALF